MATVYPINLPPEPAPMSSRMRLRGAGALAGGELSAVQRAYLWAGSERWELECEFPPMRRPLAELWISALLSLDGPWGTFYYADPDARSALAAIAGTPLVNGAGQSGEDLLSKGWAANQVLVPGIYFGIGLGFYKNIARAVADGSGNATLTLRPRFGVMGRASPAADAPIEYRNPRGLWRLTTPDQGQWTADRVSNYGLSFSAIESLET